MCSFSQLINEIHHCVPIASFQTAKTITNYEIKEDIDGRKIEQSIAAVVMEIFYREKH